MGLFARKDRERSFILVTAVSSPAAGGSRSYTFFRSLKIHQIYFSSTITTAGRWRVAFNTFDTAVQPYIMSSSDPFTLNEVLLNSWDPGQNVFRFCFPVVTDALQIFWSGAYVGDVHISIEISEL